IFLNNTTTGLNPYHITLNSATTGTFSFTPAYKASCQNCLLGWGMGEGAGIGVTPCPMAPADTFCNSYDLYHWINDPPIEYGIPQFGSTLPYASDYRWLRTSHALCAC